jgi:hypothetical protein
VIKLCQSVIEIILRGCVSEASAAVVVPPIVAGQTVETPVREQIMPMGQARDPWRRHAAVATAGWAS